MMVVSKSITHIFSITFFFNSPEKEIFMHVNGLERIFKERLKFLLCVTNIQYENYSKYEIEFLTKYCSLKSQGSKKKQVSLV